MKQISSTLLALAFVFFTLVSLILVKPSWESGPLALSDGGSRVSEVGLRINFQR